MNTPNSLWQNLAKPQAQNWASELGNLAAKNSNLNGQRSSRLTQPLAAHISNRYPSLTQFLEGRNRRMHEARENMVHQSFPVDA